MGVSKGTITISKELLKWVFLLPEDFEIIDIIYDQEKQQLDLIVQAESITPGTIQIEPAYEARDDRGQMKRVIRLKGISKR